MSNIIVLAGRKQSGKSSLANFLYGFYMTKAGVIPEFSIDDEGKLIVPGEIAGPDGQPAVEYGILDLQSPTEEVGAWASQMVWPLVKDYAFANSLKITCMNLFDLTYAQCFGTDEDKNTPSRIAWSDMHKLLDTKTKKEVKESGKFDRNMTAREVLQYFGTNVCRVMYESIWVDRAFVQIEQENPKLAVITDCRYKNEVFAAKERGAKLVKLTKKKFEDTHSSETDLDDLPDDTFDLVINNDDLTIKEKNYAMYEGLKKWNWLEISL